MIQFVPNEPPLSAWSENILLVSVPSFLPSLSPERPLLIAARSLDKPLDLSLVCPACRFGQAPAPHSTSTCSETGKDGAGDSETHRGMGWETDLPFR
jgi:hypothetical protein